MFRAQAEPGNQVKTLSLAWLNDLVSVADRKTCATRESIKDWSLFPFGPKSVARLANTTVTTAASPRGRPLYLFLEAVAKKPSNITCSTVLRPNRV